MSMRHSLEEEGWLLKHSVPRAASPQKACCSRPRLLPQHLERYVELTFEYDLFLSHDLSPAWDQNVLTSKPARFYTILSSNSLRSDDRLLIIGYRIVSSFWL